MERAAGRLGEDEERLVAMKRAAREKEEEAAFLREMEGGRGRRGEEEEEVEEDEEEFERQLQGVLMQDIQSKEGGREGGREGRRSSLDFFNVTFHFLTQCMCFHQLLTFYISLPLPPPPHSLPPYTLTQQLSWQVRR